MALIICPECGREISDKAKVCIHCGYPFDEEQTDAHIDEVSRTPSTAIHTSTFQQDLAQNAKTPEQALNERIEAEKSKALEQARFEYNIIKNQIQQKAQLGQYTQRQNMRIITTVCPTQLHNYIAYKRNPDVKPAPHLGICTL